MSDMDVTNQELKGKIKKYEGTLGKVTEEGITFRSYRDGATVFLSPESSIAAQKVFALLAFFHILAVLWSRHNHSFG
jgi:hypothetical protein